MNSERYSRQARFRYIGESGQAELQRKHALIVGLGALGSALAENLTRAGIGKLTLIDRDYVDLSNLQRQTLYNETDVTLTKPKAIAAKAHLSLINSEVKIHSIPEEANSINLPPLLDSVDLILDGTDNFETRLLINDVAQKYQVPWIYGACVGSYGLTYTILPKQTPCLRCLLNQVIDVGETCDTVGIISPAVQIVVAHQTTEALKLLTGNIESLRGTLLAFDLWKNTQTSIKVHAMKKEDCPSCSAQATYPALQSHLSSVSTTVLCGRDTIQVRFPTNQSVDLDRIARSLHKATSQVHQTEYLIHCTVDHHRLVIFRDGRMLVHGTNDKEVAKNFYKRFIK